MGAKRSRKKVEPIRTQRELADLVGRDVSAVNRWLKDERWPFNRQAPWPRAQIPKILRWVADTLESGTKAQVEKKGKHDDLRKTKLEEEIRKIRVQADTFEVALARERGSLLDAAEVERDWAGLGVLVKNGFQSFASQVVPLALQNGMPAEAAPAFGQQVAEAVTGILKHLSGNASTENN